MTATADPASETKPLTFCNTPLEVRGEIEQPTNDEIKATPQLWQASLDDALRYGGDLTRAAIGAMQLRGDKRHIVVDTKVHMLMPGFCPAIPGWHTDGVPRGVSGSPIERDKPNIWRQLDDDITPPLFHLLVTGHGALTDFYTRPINLEIPTEPTSDLYKLITEQMRERELASDVHIVTAPSCRVIEWDWWALHTARPAREHEWRFLIRVTETDHQRPQSDLRQIIRTQQQVYVPENFGW